MGDEFGQPVDAETLVVEDTIGQFWLEVPRDDPTQCPLESFLYVLWAILQLQQPFAKQIADLEKSYKI